MSEIDYFLEDDHLYRQLYRWQHKIPRLRGIRDAGLLEDHIRELENELRDDLGNPLWDDLKEWPTHLLP